MSKIAVLGGLGYFGSVLSSEILARGEEVDVYDYDLYKSGAGEFVGNIKSLDVINSTQFPTEICKYSHMYWCLDIDVEKFYTHDISKKYIEKNLKSFERCAKDYKEEFTYIGDIYKGKNDSYIKFLDDKTEICKKYNCNVVRFDVIYGSSPRMRFDTLLNNMMWQAYTQGIIVVENYLENVDIVSLMTAVKSVLKGDTGNVASCTLNKIALAHMIAQTFESDVSVMAGGKGVMSSYDIGYNYVTHNKRDIDDAVKLFMLNVKSGALDEYAGDMFNDHAISYSLNLSNMSKFFEKTNSTVTGPTGFTGER